MQRLTTARMAVLISGLLGAAGSAQAIVFDWNIGEGVSGTLNTAITLGAAWRLEDREPHLVGFGNLNPDACRIKVCQGIAQADVQPNAQRIGIPGAFSTNADDGNLNYDQGDITQGVLKLTQDIALNYKDYGFFGRLYGFYDAVNVDFREFHPNRVTDDTVANGPDVYQQGARDGFSDILGVPIEIPFPGAVGTRTLSKGDLVRNKRAGGDLKKQIGMDLRVMDAYFFGNFPIGERELSLRVGRQTVNWGESTVLVINSLNQINPPNVNNLFRVGFDLAEVFEPVGMVYGTIGLTESVNLEAFYQAEWKPVEIPAPGSYLSFIDAGTNSTGGNLTLGFGNGEDVRTRQGLPGDNLLSTITNTTGVLYRLEDNEPKDGGQFGAAIRYYAEWLNGGTELAGYAMNYHSRLPYASLYASDPSCARREGNDNGPGGQGIDAFDTVTFGIACPDLPLQYQLTGRPTTLATDNAIPFDTIRVQLEYPEDIQLYGASFNTSFGELAIQGEVAYRPELPIQVDTEDLVFAAFQPVLGRCHGTGGTTPCVGTPTSGSGTFSIGAPLAGDYTGSARSFPSYVVAYRGLVHEEIEPNSYIRGYEEFESYQFNIGGTYIYKPSFNLASMDQAIVIFETGAQYVPDITGPCELPLEGPGTFTHSGPGADGTGTERGGSARTCVPEGSRTENQNADGSDGLRFNPTQQVGGFPDDFSAGYRVVLIPRWESILPGISIQPIILYAHDFHGTSPGPAESFLQGRTVVATDVEIRYKTNWAYHIGYTSFSGARPYNLLEDRDYVQAWVKYSF